jgi:hypothetical protein
LMFETGNISFIMCIPVPTVITITTLLNCTILIRPQ